MNEFHPAIVRACKALRPQSPIPPVFFLKDLPEALLGETLHGRTALWDAKASMAGSLIDAADGGQGGQNWPMTTAHLVRGGASLIVGWGWASAQADPIEVLNGQFVRLPLGTRRYIIPRPGRFLIRGDPEAEALPRDLLALPAFLGLGERMHPKTIPFVCLCADGTALSVLDEDFRKPPARPGKRTEIGLALRRLASAMSWAFCEVEDAGLWPVLAAGLEQTAGACHWGVFVRPEPLLIACDWIEERGGGEAARRMREEIPALADWGFVGCGTGENYNCIYALEPGRERMLPPATFRGAHPWFYTEFRGMTLGDQADG